jgi:hypothetical protein
MYFPELTLIWCNWLMLYWKIAKIHFSIAHIWKQQEEITRWWPIYLDDQDCVGKVQLCMNLSMSSNDYGSAKVCSSLFILIWWWMCDNSASILTLHGIIKIDATRWSSCGYNYIWHGSGSSDESSKFQQQNVAHKWFMEMAVRSIFWLLWGVWRI